MCHEGPHELVADSSSDRIDINVPAGQKFERVSHLADARRLNADRLETGRGELHAIVALVELAGDVVDPK